MNLNCTKRVLLFFITLISLQSFAQTVSGVVSTNQGPLPGANVLVKGTTNGVVTDFDGKYTINNLGENAILVFSYLGYTTKEVTVNQQKTINVTLEENAQALDEIIVVGYGTQKKSTLTTAISTVKNEEIKEIPVADIAQSLQGRAAGVSITNSGSPGSQTLVRIRGLGTFGDGNPLFVVDGVFTQSINSINPSSVVKVDILKDAAATAIYGSRGSNGVIIITTDQGKEGAVSFKFNTYSGFQFSNKRYDVLNTEQYVQYLREIDAQTTGGTAVGVIRANPEFNGNGVETDWQDALFRSALLTNYDFNVSGGSKKGKYSFGVSAYDQDGIYIDTNFKRYTFNVGSEAKVFKHLTVGENFAFGYNETIAPEIDGGREPIFNVINSAPYIPVRNEDGTFAGSAQVDVNNSRNQIRIQSTNDNLNRFTSIIGNVYALLDLGKGFTFRSQYGLDANFNFQDNIRRAYEEVGGQFSDDFTNISKVRQNFASTIFTNSFSYQNSFGKHNVNTTIVSERQNTRLQLSRASEQTDISSEINELSNGIATSFTVDDNLISYLGRVNYDYDGKYLFQASIRRDKSSIFAPGNQVGWFPAGSLGWVVSKEKFLENTIINNLKIRGSYGITGNNRVARNQSVNVFQATLSTRFNFAIDNELSQGVAPNGANNFDLTWEEATKQNYGFDLGLWNNRVTFAADYYINSSDGLIVAEPQAPSAGIPGNITTGGSVFKNVGDVEVSGFEFTLGYNDYIGDFKWNFWGNISTSRSEVNELGDVDQILQANYNPPFSESLSRIAQGEPLFHFFGFDFEGVYADEQAIIDHIGADNLDPNSGQAFQPRPGDARFRDVNGDGDITNEDRIVIGDPNPDFTFAVSLKAEYKGFDVSALITGVVGVDALNANTFLLQGQENVLNQGTEVLRRWQNPGDITDVPRFRFEGNNPNNNISTRYIEDASYARLRNLTVGYSIPKKVTDNIFNGALKKVRFYLQSQNLFTLTEYSGLDPEIAPFYGGSGLVEGLSIDRGRQPQPTTVLTGLQIEF